MNHIDRMKEELRELEEKYKKENIFLASEQMKITSSNPSMLNDSQRLMLEEQLKYMKLYIEVLKRRIQYDILKV